MVTWGQNTVHTVPGNPPAAPAPGGLFGGTPAAPAAPAAGGFGSPSTPSAPGGGLFGSSTPAPAAPVAGTSLFGTPAPAAPSPGGGLFGAPAAPAAAPTSLFGTPAPSSGGGLFGSTTTPAFGAAPAPAFGAAPAAPFGSPAPGTMQAGTQQQIPAQAALQAHMDASARQESARVMSAMQGLHTAYTGAMPSPQGDQQEYKFLSIVYNELTPEQRQQQWLHGVACGNSVPVAPPKPPQVPEDDWNRAVVRNPDPLSYMPNALVGAEALQARLSWQQDKATQLAKDAATIQTTHDTVRERCNQGGRLLEKINRTHDTQRKRLLNVMRKVEVVRCMNLGIQPDEIKAMERLITLEKGVNRMRTILTDLQDRARAQPAMRHHVVETTELPDKTRLFHILKGHREEIAALTSTMHKDMRDADLVQKRLAVSAAAPTLQQLR